MIFLQGVGQAMMYLIGTIKIALLPYCLRNLLDPLLASSCGILGHNPSKHDYQRNRFMMSLIKKIRNR